MKRAKYFVIGLVAACVVAPCCAFEAVVWYGCRGENLPRPAARTSVPLVMREALWIASGETPGDRLDALWVGNFFRFHENVPQGRYAAGVVARRIVYQDPQRQLRTMEHHLRTGAVTVWLSRHMTAADLKQSLTESAYFGRGTWGASAAARAYFGQPLERLSTGQLVVLAALPQAPDSLDPTCHTGRVQRRQAYLLRRLRMQGVISQSEFDAAEHETLGAVSHGARCTEDAD